MDMEERKYSPPSTTSTATATAAANREQKASIKENCLAFGVSLQEVYRYAKAFFVGQVKKLKARDEKEATIAELQAQKMQVEAADDAENTKKRIYKSM